MHQRAARSYQPAPKSSAQETNVDSSAFERLFCRESGSGNLVEHSKKKGPAHMSYVFKNTRKLTQLLRARVRACAGAAESLHTYIHHPAPSSSFTPVGGWEGPPCVLVPPAVWCPPAAPPRCCVPPCGGRVPPLRWVLAPCAGAPLRCCGPDRDHCYDRLGATAPHRIHSLARWRHQGSGHPHAYGSCVRRAGTVHAVIHSPQQAFSQQSSGAAASRSRSHSSATNMVAAPVMVMLP